VRVLAISGSLRWASFNTTLLREAARLAPLDMDIEHYSELEALPAYNEDLDTEAPPAEVVRLRRAIAGADAVLISTPEYNGTVPGQLKHAIDWASRPKGERAALWGKPVAVMGASTSQYGALWAQDHVRKALGLAGARVLESGVSVARAAQQFAADGKLTDGEIRAQLQGLLAELSEYGAVLLAA
jgi:chromate reductase, NAD(P)H dehydrogenase (quinone)